MPSPRTLRFTSAITLLFFAASLPPGLAASQTSGFLPQASEFVQSAYNAADSSAAFPGIPNIPKELGILAQSFAPEANAQSEYPEGRRALPLVIHIQDAHANIDAQTKVLELLNWLKSSHDAKDGFPLFVAVEGAVGALNPEYLDIFPDHEKASDAIVEDLFRKGELTGSEIFLWQRYLEQKKEAKEGPVSLVSPFPVYAGTSVYGAETPGLFKDNLSDYRTILSSQDTLNGLAVPLEARLSIAGSRLLNPALRDFIRATERIETLPLTIIKNLSAVGIKLENPVEQIRFPSLTRFVKVQEMEQFLDAKLARMEWESLLKSLPRKSKENDEALKNFENVLFGEVSGTYPWREILRGMIEGLQKKTSLNDYPNFSRWLTYHVLRSEIDTRDLVSEVESLRYAIMDRMAKEPAERAYIEVYQRFSNLKKLLQAEISRDEYSLIEKRKQEFLPSVIADEIDAMLDERKTPADILAEHKVDRKALNKHFKTALKFYTGAERRDRALVENALAAYGSLQDFYSVLSRSEEQSSVMVLITGGFHSDGITALLKEKGVAHIVITPRLTSVEDNGLYHKVMSRKHANLEGYFRDTVFNKQEAIFFREILEVAPPVLVRDYGVTPQQIPDIISKIMKEHPVLKNRLTGEIVESDGKTTFKIEAKPASLAHAHVQNQTIRDVSLLGRAGNGASSFSYLASELPSGRGPQTVEMIVSPGGYLVPKNTAPDSGSLADRIVSGQIGGVQASVGPIDPAILGQLKDLTAVLGGEVPRIGRRIYESGPTGLVQPEGRSELRTPAQAPGKPSVGQILITLDNEPKQEEINRIVDNNEIVYVTADVAERTDYEAYVRKLENYLSAIAEAVRQFHWNPANYEKHRVIVFKTWTSVGHTEKFFNDIKVRMRPEQPPFYDNFYFDVVFQPPAFQYVDESGNQVEDVTVFGLREEGKTDLPEPYVQRMKRTRDLLELAFEDEKAAGKLEFTDVRTAEQVKEDLIIALASRLAHFNDLAKVSRSYGADLSVIAYGAGLDKRIRKLFSNPSMGFGGRLAEILEWIIQERIETIRKTYESSKSFMPEEMQKKDAAAKRLYIRDMARKAVGKLREKSSNPDSSITIEEILKELPVPELRYVFLLENLLMINEANRQDFIATILNYAGRNLNGKKVAISGAAFREGEDKIIKSPIKTLIRQLAVAGVKEFYISDPKARYALLKWKQTVIANKDDALSSLFNSPDFHLYGVDEGSKSYTIYEAFKEADLAIIATTADPELKRLDITKLKVSLGEKPLFDAINIVGLRADGTFQHSIEAVRSEGIRYISVGRPGVNAGPAEYYLADSVVIGEGHKRGDINSESMTIAEYHTRILDLETDSARETALRDVFQGRAISDKGSVADVAFIKNVVLVGGGYVGLTTGANIAQNGHNVTVIDIPQKKPSIDALQGPDTEMPIFEPGLRDMIINGKEAGKLFFVASPDENRKAIENSSIIYLAVGTPQQDNGAQDTIYIENTIRGSVEKVRSPAGGALAEVKMFGIGEIIRDQLAAEGQDKAFKTIVIKSTVTPQVFVEIERIMRREFGLMIGVHYALASNPEFLREGEAIKDITEDLDRTVLGIYAGMPEATRARVEKDLLELWEPLMVRYPHTVLVTDTATSTLIKYAANAFLAVSITMSNVMAEASTLNAALFRKVADLLKRDNRVGANAFLSCGPGYGGSCFPKDVLAVNFLSSDRADWPLQMIIFAHEMNQFFKTAYIEKLIDALRGNRAWSATASLEGKHIGIWGMAFKPRTDDMRETPTAHILARLIKLSRDKAFFTLDDPILRGDEAPAREKIIANFIGELYKHFKNEPDFIEAYRTADNPASRYHQAYTLAQKPADKTRFFVDVFFKVRYLDAGIVAFAVSKEEVFTRFGQPPDALLIVTDWAEYKDADLTALQGGIIVDTRDTLFRRQAELQDKQIRLIAPGRAVTAPAQRSELRNVTAQVAFAVGDLSREIPDTDRFAERLGQVEVPVYGNRGIDELTEQFPELRREQAVMAVTGSFSDPRLMEKVEPLAVWQFLKLMLGSQGAVSRSQLPDAVAQAREALGEFAWLLDQSDTPINIINPLSAEGTNDDFLRVAGVLAATHKQMKFILTVPGEPGEARRYVEFLKERLRELKLPVEDIIDQFEFIAASGSLQTTVQTIKQSFSLDRKAGWALMHESPELLDELQYVKGMARIEHAIPESQAVAIVAALLKKLLDDYPYDKVQLEKALERYDINVQSLIENVAAMIRVLNHLATQA